MFALKQVILTWCGSWFYCRGSGGKKWGLLGLQRSGFGVAAWAAQWILWWNTEAKEALTVTNGTSVPNRFTLHSNMTCAKEMLLSPHLTMFHFRVRQWEVTPYWQCAASREGRERTLHCTQQYYKEANIKVITSRKDTSFFNNKSYCIRVKKVKVICCHNKHFTADCVTTQTQRSLILSLTGAIKERKNTKTKGFRY